VGNERENAASHFLLIISPYTKCQSIAILHFFSLSLSPLSNTTTTHTGIHSARILSGVATCTLEQIIYLRLFLSCLASCLALAQLAATAKERQKAYKFKNFILEKAPNTSQNICFTTLYCCSAL